MKSSTLRALCTGLRRRVGARSVRDCRESQGALGRLYRMDSSSQNARMAAVDRCIVVHLLQEAEKITCDISECVKHAERWSSTRPGEMETQFSFPLSRDRGV